MNSDQTHATPEEHRTTAKRLVAHLNAAERFVLIGLIGGMSKRAIAAESGQSLGDVELALASLMNKLDARTYADAVRIGLEARDDRPN